MVIIERDSVCFRIVYRYTVFHPLRFCVFSGYTASITIVSTAIQPRAYKLAYLSSYRSWTSMIHHPSISIIY